VEQRPVVLQGHLFSQQAMQLPVLLAILTLLAIIFI
jgi:hypothetical protein